MSRERCRTPLERRRAAYLSFVGLEPVWLDQ